MFMLLAHVCGDEPVSERPLGHVEIGMFVMIGISQLGVLLCWWKPLLGGWIMVIGWVGLICLQWFLILNPFFGLPAIAGVLLILAERGREVNRDREVPAPASPE
jgi:hypothetical protein